MVELLLKKDDNNLLEYDRLRSFLENKADKRFDRLVSDRSSLESQWVDILQAVKDGSAPNPAKNILMPFYTNLGDMTLPSMVRKLIAKETAWIKKDIIRWKPDGLESTDTEGADWLSDYQMDNLNCEHSNFHSVIRAALWQRSILPLSAINFNWVVLPKYQYDYSTNETEDGNIEFASYNRQIMPLEYELQGLRFEFISIFDIYPDNIQTTMFDSLSKLDLYWRTYRSYKQVKKHPMFSPEAFYPFKANVLYRSTYGIDDLKLRGTSYTPAQMRLNSKLDSGTSDNNNELEKHMIELRTCYVKEVSDFEKLNIPNVSDSCTSDGRGYRIIYAKSGSDCVPLFVESNFLPFEQKTIRLSRRDENPHYLYAPTEVGMSVNQHFYIVNNKQQQAHSLARSVNPNLLWLTSLLDAFEGSATELKATWTQAGTNQFINAEKLKEATELGADPTKPIVLGDSNQDAKNLEILEQAIQKAKLDIQQINTQVNDELGAGATAQYNKQVAAEQDLLSTESKRATCDDWLRPALHYGYDMASRVFKDQKFSASISESDRKMLVGKVKELAGEGEEYSYDDLTRESEETGQTLMIPRQVANQEVPVQYNPATHKKQMILTKTFFQNTKASLSLQFDSMEYSKPLLLEQKVRQFGDILKFLPESPLTMLVAKKAVENILELNDDEGKDLFMEELNKWYEQSQQPPQPDPLSQKMQQLEVGTKEAELQKTQAEGTLKQAQATKTIAEAKEEQSRTTAQNMRNIEDAMKPQEAELTGIGV